MSVEELILKKVKAWIDIADEDLEIAQFSLTSKKKCPYRLIAFHAQQSVEKYLKSFLIYKNVQFPYTHSIVLLIDLCSEVATDWIEEIKEAEELTPYAINARYPDEIFDVNREMAVRGVFIAHNVRNIVRKALVDLGLSL